MINTSSPGRICLFGEHQDYLGLPVMAAAVNMRASFEAVPNGEQALRVSLPDIGTDEIIDPRAPLEYRSKRDYLRSGVNVLLREGYEFSAGHNITLRSDIPIGKGCSSSSAMIVAWVGLLSRVATKGAALGADDCARFTHRAEVVEFGEPGGMMDHFTSALGGLLYIETSGEARTRPIDANIEGAFILGDSLTPKDTTGVLGAAKSNALSSMDFIRRSNPAADWNIITADDARKAASDMPDALLNAAIGNIENRDIAREAADMLLSGNVAPASLGALLTRQHRNLSVRIGVSTPKIDAMVDAAIEAGAWGAKINGSGGGGCMFAYADERVANDVSLAIKSAGGAARRVYIDTGFREDT